MGSMSELWDERQIQILVLLSFVLQVFLFFAGSFRYCSTNSILRISLWISYLGADSVAVYVLGLISRQQDAAPNGPSEIQPLAFIWAPFLLIHLGGQDTITAFSLEDNGLWLRHLLNLVLQLVLALYVFWKSTMWHNERLLVIGICLFLAGTIKYGERTMALKYGKPLDSYTGDDNKLPLPQDNADSEKHGVISFALRMVPGARQVFDGGNIDQMNAEQRKNFLYLSKTSIQRRVVLKVLEVVLRLIYDDLYTKALVLRRRTGIIGRFISLVSTIVAFVLFFTIPDKQKYSKPDLAITYTLLMGGICLEICATFMMVLSAWTWGWLETWRYHWLADMLMWLLSSRIALLSEKRTLWSYSMGQYEYVKYYVGKVDGVSKMSSFRQWIRRIISWKQLVMKTLKFVGFGTGTLFHFSKYLETKEVTVDQRIMELLFVGVYHVQGMALQAQDMNTDIEDLVHLPPAVSEATFVHDFGKAVVMLHMLTALHLRRYELQAGDKDPVVAMVCFKLSNYMFYLLVTHPEMLPVNGSAEATLESYIGSQEFKAMEDLHDKRKMPEQRIPQQTMEELRDMWIYLLMYVAGKSRPEGHAAHLGRGGQLLTFVWLLMLQCDLGDLGRVRIEISADDKPSRLILHKLRPDLREAEVPIARFPIPASSPEIGREGEPEESNQRQSASRKFKFTAPLHRLLSFLFTAAGYQRQEEEKGRV